MCYLYAVQHIDYLFVFIISWLLLQYLRKNYEKVKSGEIFKSIQFFRLKNS